MVLSGELWGRLIVYPVGSFRQGRKGASRAQTQTEKGSPPEHDSLLSVSTDPRARTEKQTSSLERWRNDTQRILVVNYKSIEATNNEKWSDR